MSNILPMDEASVLMRRRVFDQMLSRGKGLKDISRTVAEEVERERIEATLRVTGWNRSKAARMLRISNRAIHYKIKQLQITEPK